MLLIFVNIWFFFILGGGLSIKLLKRTAHFGSGEKSSMVTNSQPHNIKLLVPKKSRLFVEQTLRERDQCHGNFNFIAEMCMITLEIINC